MRIIQTQIIYEKYKAFRESDSGHLAPKVRIIPLDQMLILKYMGLYHYLFRHCLQFYSKTTYKL